MADDTTTTQDPTTTDAYQSALGLLRSWGLEELGPTVLKILQSGYTDSGAIQAQLEQTDAFKQRFAGNELRRAAGLNVLSIPEYLANENAYKAILRNAGLPPGFYSDKASIDKFIGNDVAPQELAERVSTAKQMVDQVDPNDRAAFQHYYGIDNGHLMAYFLDPKQGTNLLNQRAAAAQIGGAATRQGLRLTDQSRALQFAQNGVTGNQADKAYGDIAQLLPEEQRIAARQGQKYSQTDAENELLGGLASAARKRQRLNQGEENLFAGHGGAGDTFMHEGYGLAGTSAGQF